MISQLRTMHFHPDPTAATVGRRLQLGGLRRGGWRLLTAACCFIALAGEAQAQTPTAIYVMRVDGTDVRKLATAPDFKSVGHPRWSHDGKRVAFHGWDGPNRGRQVFVSDASAAGPPTGGPEGQLVDWSPDDKQLAFQTPAAIGGGATAWVESLDGTGRTELATGSSPRWSPDGGRLAFVEGGNLMVRDLATDQQEALVGDRWQSIQPGFCWSPDGKQIAFVARRDGVPGLWIVDVKNPVPRLRVKGKVMGHVAWSPDGKQLAITLDSLIQLLNVNDTQRPKPIPGQIGNSRDPAWSPDGKSIAFSSNRGPTGP